MKKPLCQGVSILIFLLIFGATVHSRVWAFGPNLDGSKKSLSDGEILKETNAGKRQSLFFEKIHGLKEEFKKRTQEKKSLSIANELGCTFWAFSQHFVVAYDSFLPVKNEPVLLDSAEKYLDSSKKYFQLTGVVDDFGCVLRKKIFERRLNYLKEQVNLQMIGSFEEKLRRYSCDSAFVEELLDDLALIKRRIGKDLDIRLSSLAACFHSYRLYKYFDDSLTSAIVDSMNLYLNGWRGPLSSSDSIFLLIYFDSIASIPANIPGNIKKIEFDSGLGEAYWYAYNLYSIDGELSSLKLFDRLFYDFRERGGADLRIAFQLDSTWAEMAREIGLSDNFPIIHRSKSDSVLLQIFRRQLELVKANDGEVRFSLLWDNHHDVDLYVIDPQNDTIYFGNKTSRSGGTLDIDQNRLCLNAPSGNVIENIRWDIGNAPFGRYKVWAEYYEYGKNTHNHDSVSTQCTLEVKLGTELKHFSQVLIGEGGQSQLIEFDYAEPVVRYDFIKDSARQEFENYIAAMHDKELAFVAIQRLVEMQIYEQNFSAAADSVSKYLGMLDSTDIAFVKSVEFLALLRSNLVSPKGKHLTSYINNSKEQLYPILDEKNHIIHYLEQEIGVGSLVLLKTSQKRDGKFERPSDTLWDHDKFGVYYLLTSISESGREALFFRDGDIYISWQDNDGSWVDPKALEAINSVYWDGDAIFSHDMKHILFASSRPGGYNIHSNSIIYHGEASHNSDLYISHLTDSSTFLNWTKPVNLGSEINTQYSERAPCLSADDSTLYFSSDGYSGFGRHDYYFSRQTKFDRDWRNWTIPKNLGMPYNDHTSNIRFAFSNGGSALISSVDFLGDDSVFDRDLVEFTIPDTSRPRQAFDVTLELVDSGGKPLVDSVFVYFLEGSSGWRSPHGGCGRTGLDGVAKAVLVSGKYIFSFPGTGIKLTLLVENDEINKKIVASPLSQAVIDSVEILLKNLVIQFPFGIDYPNDASMAEVDKLVQILKTYDNFEISLIGHTDNIGSSEFNKRLSIERASRVMQYLVSKGVEKKIMIVLGEGEERPMAENTTYLNRQQNRRVEARLLGVKVTEIRITDPDSE